MNKVTLEVVVRHYQKSEGLRHYYSSSTSFISQVKCHSLAFFLPVSFTLKVKRSCELTWVMLMTSEHFLFHLASEAKLKAMTRSSRDSSKEKIRFNWCLVPFWVAFSWTSHDWGGAGFQPTITSRGLARDAAFTLSQWVLFWRFKTFSVSKVQS